MPIATPELMEAARSGDGKALNQLLSICQPDLKRYARWACATEDIEDAVQDALIILYRRLGALRTIAAFSSWVFQIVKRECLRRLKLRTDLKDEAESLPAADGAADIGLRFDLVRIIQSLPPIYRDVLILRDVNELTAD